MKQSLSRFVKEHFGYVSGVSVAVLLMDHPLVSPDDSTHTSSDDPWSLIGVHQCPMTHRLVLILDASHLLNRSDDFSVITLRTLLVLSSVVLFTPESFLALSQINIPGLDVLSVYCAVSKPLCLVSYTPTSLPRCSTLAAYFAGFETLSPSDCVLPNLSTTLANICFKHTKTEPCATHFSPDCFFNIWDTLMEFPCTLEISSSFANPLSLRTSTWWYSSFPEKVSTGSFQSNACYEIFSFTAVITACLKHLISLYHKGTVADPEHDVGLFEMIAVLVEFSTISPACFFCALIILDRLRRAGAPPHLVLSMNNCNILFPVVLNLCAKSFENTTVSSTYYTVLQSFFPLKLRPLELEVLTFLRFSLRIDPKDLSLYIRKSTSHVFSQHCKYCSFFINLANTRSSQVCKPVDTPTTCALGHRDCIVQLSDLGPPLSCSECLSNDIITFTPSGFVRRACSQGVLYSLMLSPEAKEASNLGQQQLEFEYLYKIPGFEVFLPPKIITKSYEKTYTIRIDFFADTVGAPLFTLHSDNYISTVISSSDCICSTDLMKQATQSEIYSLLYSILIVFETLWSYGPSLVRGMYPCNMFVSRGKSGLQFKFLPFYAEKDLLSFQILNFFDRSPEDLWSPLGFGYYFGNLIRTLCPTISQELSSLLNLCNQTDVSLTALKNFIMKIL
ncbi:hypothetical protein GEMRC1_002384 [Eukaryota sp. GEM-RC1]